MRKWTLIFLCLTLMFNSCKKEEKKSSPLIAGNVDYEFTIKINGDVHKIEGNTIDGVPWGSPGVTGMLNNRCASMNQTVLLNINDKSEFNFVSGDVIGCSMLFPNMSLGINNVNISFLVSSIASGYWMDLADSLQADPTTIQATMGPDFNQYDIPITITDLGSAPTLTPPDYFHNSTLKGNFNDTVYLRNIDVSSPDFYTWSIPIHLEIDFKTVRIE